MTFEEATENINVLSSFSTLYGISPKVVQDIINSLKQEYAPTIEMTKNDRDILLYNLENYSFDIFAESIALSDKEKFGLPANKEFEGLSIEQLMQAWLNPENIKVVE